MYNALAEIDIHSMNWKFSKRATNSEEQRKMKLFLFVFAFKTLLCFNINKINSFFNITGFSLFRNFEWLSGWIFEIWFREVQNRGAIQRKLYFYSKEFFLRCSFNVVTEILLLLAKLKSLNFLRRLYILVYAYSWFDIHKRE